jgi:hypothetical protein
MTVFASAIPHEEQKQQVPPLRFAPVGMTHLDSANAKSLQLELTAKRTKDHRSEERRARSE